MNRAESSKVHTRVKELQLQVSKFLSSRKYKVRFNRVVTFGNVQEYIKENG